MTDDHRPFRILSLDGGGVRGIFAAACLAHIEDNIPRRLSTCFDLLVGTSTGAIIALGLASGLTAPELLALYQNDAKRIFAHGRRSGGYLAPKHNNRELLAILRDTFGDRRLDDLAIPVCIPSYELVSAVPRVFKDNHHSELHWGGDQLVWKVAAASSAAPTYFPAFQIARDDCHVDGGVWASNPSLVGVTEAVRYFGKGLQDISLLSIGTGRLSFRATYDDAHTWGKLGWIRSSRIIDLVFQAQAEAVHNSVKLLIDDGSRYLRIDVDLTQRIPLDDFQAAESLVERGVQEGRTHLNEIRDRFVFGAES
jgi:uncharacterized protein